MDILFSILACVLFVAVLLYLTPFFWDAILNFGAAFNILSNFLVTAFLVVCGIGLTYLAALALIEMFFSLKRRVTGQQEQWEATRQKLKNETPEDRRLRWIAEQIAKSEIAAYEEKHGRRISQDGRREVMAKAFVEARAEVEKEG